jgi:hypothetical protein
MPIDYETVRRNNPPPALPGDWAGREAAAVAAARADMAKRREEEQHTAECAAYAGFARQRAAQAQKRNHRGDDLVAKVWTDEAARIARGECTSHRVIRSDYEANAKFASLRTRLAYAGKMFESKD